MTSPTYRTDLRGAAGAESRARSLARLDRIARLMDSRFVIPGTRIGFGLDALIDLIPGIGNFGGTAISAYLIWEAWRLGAPALLLARMCGNVGIDFVVGAVPVAGAIADIFWRANTRNMDLLRRHLEDRTAR